MRIGTIPEELCCGCASCSSICPVGAITFSERYDGFFYPVINNDQCIDCGKCGQCCPAINDRKLHDREARSVYAAVSNNMVERENSSSGGVFSLLAKAVLECDGIVFGAAFDSNWNVNHIGVRSLQDLEKLRGSKYVQSNTVGVFEEIKTVLDCGTKVLFSGTPCQCEGLVSFLGKNYDNLILVDFVCHGVPSPFVWRRYLDNVKGTRKIRSINFRSKSISWEHFSLEINFDDNTKYKSEVEEDLYLKGFLSDLYLRKSCYNCHFRGKNRISDITLADFWGIESVIRELSDHKGTSLIITNSRKGSELFSNIDVTRVLLENDASIIQYNPAYYYNPPLNPRRESFFKMMKSNMDVLDLISRETRAPLTTRIRCALARVSVLRSIYLKLKSMCVCRQ